MPFVYMLECADGSYYVGSTWDLERRVGEHNEGLGASFTHQRRPVTLRWSAFFARVDDAFLAEKRLQGWGRAKRRALIDGKVHLLKGLASRSWADRQARRER